MFRTTLAQLVNQGIIQIGTFVLRQVVNHKPQDLLVVVDFSTGHDNLELDHVTFAPARHAAHVDQKIVVFVDRDRSVYKLILGVRLAEEVYVSNWRPILLHAGNTSEGARHAAQGMWEELLERLVREYPVLESRLV